MAEQYGVAAWRHHDVAETLEHLGFLDDAGYHFGVCGENAVKHSLRAAGVESVWVAAKISLKKTPMKQHFPTLKSFVKRAQADIAVNAQGRFAAAVASLVLDPSFANRFNGWHINIRYADTTNTPVAGGTCSGWHTDADDLVLGLVL